MRSTIAFGLAALLLGPALGAQVLDQTKISAATTSLPGTLGLSDALGASAATLGDLDGDGRVQVAVGAPTYGVLPSQQDGAVFVLELQPDGTVLGALRIDEGNGGFGGVLDDDDEFGCDVTSLGDVDGDGVADLAVGARNDDDGASNAGAVWILFLNPDGSARGWQKISTTTGGGPPGLGTQSRFGEGVEGLGDLDQDGVPDLAVAKPVGGFLDPSGIWILFLNPDGTVKASNFLAAGAGTPLSGVGVFSEFATDMALLSNEPIATSIQLCANEPDGGPNGEGAVWYMLVDRAGGLVFAREITEGLGGFNGDLQPGDRFGEALEAIDLDGDASRDLVVGAPGSSLDEPGAGALWFLSLFANGNVLSTQVATEGAGGFGGAVDAGDALGTALAALGDLDGNGFDDVLVGAPGDDDGAVDAGAAWVATLFPACGTQATSTVRNGSGTNALLLSSVTPPVLGSDWGMVLDCTGHAPAFAAVAVYAAPSSGFFLGGGELLVDVSSAFAASALLPHSGDRVSLSIEVPAQTALCGFTASAQGVVLGAPGYELSNALDGVAGR